MKVPCMDCDKRHLGCHSVCEQYKQFVKEKDAINEKRKKINNTIADCVAIRQHKVEMLSKKKRPHKMC